MRALLHVFLLTGCALIAGCKASASASANVNASQHAELEEQAETSAPTASPAAASAAADDYALLGARHDLRFQSSSGATCQCVAAGLGGTDLPGLQWRSAVPQIDVTTQLVLALSSEGVPCPGAPKGSLGASYWGYRQVGDDVVVLLEAARDGRPITTGAIIPKPTGNGKVYLQPLIRTLPYGKPLGGGGGACVLGNPGAMRAAAPAEAPPAEDDGDNAE